MKKIEASRLNRSLKEVLDGIAAGEKFEITRYGKTVAKLVPPNSREATITTVPARDIVVGPDERPKPKTKTPEQTRQRQRDFLLGRINKPPKT